MSDFGWLDTDDERRRQVMEVLELFKELRTVDELGIGQIHRDKFFEFPE